MHYSIQNWGKSSPKRNENTVTINEYKDVISILDEMPIDQLQKLHKRVVAVIAKRQAPDVDEDFLYFRKGEGVVHLAVNRHVTICGRPTNEMVRVETDSGSRICSRCAKARERSKWWQDWRKYFGDGA